MKGKKSIVIKIALGALLLCAAVGVTWALIGMNTQTERNTFTSSRKIDICLREPNWDGYTFEDGDGVYPLGLRGKTGSVDLGVNKAKNYVPGDVIPKNPTVKNREDDAYIGLKVTYYIEGNQVSREQLQKLISWDIDNSAWESTEAKDNADFYYYKGNEGLKLVGKDTETTSLFTKVTIRSDIAETYHSLYPNTKEGTYPKFEIRVVAYGVQADSADSTEDKAAALDEMKQLAEI